MNKSRSPGVLLLGGLMVVLGLLAAACSGQRPSDRVHVLEWDGMVNPVMERYINRGIETAEKSNARAVVIQLDTPGGLDTSTRDIVKRIESARVPVIVYVSPSGGRAASAGTFITLAGHVAAMAPNTTIGAATPINSDGEDIEGALGRKVINDSVAYIRGIAELRDRNADWAESAVRDAASIGQTEAVQLNVVDFVATGMDDLLRQSDGRSVQVPDSSGALASMTLRTEGAALEVNGPNIFEELLYLIASPDIAFLLLTLGGLAIAAEIFHTSGVTGIFGVIAIVLAFFALGALPTNWAGVALIALAFVLLVSEVFVSGFGVLGIGGIAALIFGGLILTGSGETGYQVSRWLVIGMGALLGVSILLVLSALMRMRRMPHHSGRESLIGLKGTARSDLTPRGVVLVAGERWEATADDGFIDDGMAVIVTATDGLKLRVKRDPESIKLLPSGNLPPQEA